MNTVREALTPHGVRNVLSWDIRRPFPEFGRSSEAADPIIAGAIEIGLGMYDFGHGLAVFGSKLADPTNEAGTGGLPIALHDIVTGPFYAGNGIWTIFTGEKTDEYGLPAGERATLREQTVNVLNAVAFAFGVKKAVARGEAVTAAPAAVTTASGVAKMADQLAPGRNLGVRVVASEAELRAVFDKMSVGGKDVTPSSYAGKMVELPDGTRVGIRDSSKSGGATIDVYPSSNRPRIKVHIEPRP